MKKRMILLATLTMLLDAGSVCAFSTAQRGVENADGSPRFADPDEQQPAFVTAPAGTADGSTLPFGTNAVTPPTPGQYDRGAAAFEDAYSHLQSH